MAKFEKLVKRKIEMGRFLLEAQGLVHACLAMETTQTLRRTSSTESKVTLPHNLIVIQQI